MMLQEAKIFLKIYSLIILLILAYKMLKLAGTDKSFEGAITVAAIIPIFIYIANMEV